MDDQRVSDESLPDHRGPSGHLGASAPEPGSGYDVTQLFAPPHPADNGQGPSLSGSLSAFPLYDVLSLLAATDQTGSLVVTGDGVDSGLAFEGGAFSIHTVDPTTIERTVFELACLDEGSFSFVAGPAASGHSTIPVTAVLAEVRPRVNEWRDIRKLVPLSAVVALALEAPTQDIQITGDQWRILSTVGNSGRTVGEVLSLVGGDQMDGLRAVRALQVAGLVVMAIDGPHDVAAVGELPPPPAPRIEEALAGAGEAVRDHFGNLAEVTMMPPPIANDPWAPSPGVSTSLEEPTGSGVA